MNVKAICYIILLIQKKHSFCKFFFRITVESICIYIYIENITLYSIYEPLKYFIFYVPTIPTTTKG